MGVLSGKGSVAVEGEELIEADARAADDADDADDAERDCLDFLCEAVSGTVLDPLGAVRVCSGLRTVSQTGSSLMSTPGLRTFNVAQLVR